MQLVTGDGGQFGVVFGGRVAVDEGGELLDGGFCLFVGAQGGRDGGELACAFGLGLLKRVVEALLEGVVFGG